MRFPALPNQPAFTRFSGVLLLALVFIATGCSRKHFRERADSDVEGLINQKNVFPDWKVENWHVYPDGRSRFHDPSATDFPQYPPDDYASWVLSPNPQKPGKSGTGRTEGTGYIDLIQQWDAENRAAKPSPAPIPTEQDPAAVIRIDAKTYRLTLEQSVELALFNSREFQDRREDLYLAALPVTQERFDLGAQAFAAESFIREATGADTAEGAGNRWRINSSPSVGRTFANGSQLLVSLANQVVIELNSNKPTVSLSNLSLTFLQPFFRGGGLAVTLEALTQAERTLLYAIRSYARFRKVFYVAIAGTGDYTNNPYGLQGLAANLGRAVGNNLTAPRAGYLPTLLRSATLANEQKNVAALGQTLQLFKNLTEGGVATQLQTVRVEQQLIRSRTTVLNNTRLYQEAADNFKLQLGIPVTMELELDDSPLTPIRAHISKFETLYSQLRELQNTAGKFDPAEEPLAYRERVRKLFTDSPLAVGTQFAKDITAKLAAVKQLSDADLEKKIVELDNARQKLLDARAERQLVGKPDTADDEKALDENEAASDLAIYEQAQRKYETKPWIRLPAERRAGEQAALFRAAFESAMLLAVQPRSERLEGLRNTWPPLPGVVIEEQDLVRIPQDEAFNKVGQVALTNRLDLMNARAQVVDTWRKIAVAANALQGAFDVQYNLNTGTPTGDGSFLGFVPGKTKHQLVLRADLPIVRRAERNAYRTALISYQRQRRLLMAFEDNILTDTRADLRQLRLTAETYRLQQRAVELAFAQVDNARATLLAPPDPQARDNGGGAAALTEQLLNAQDGLVQAQNGLYTAWVNYLTGRMELYLDLDLLPLDPRGVWTDERNPIATPRPAEGLQQGNPVPSGGR